MFWTSQTILSPSSCSTWSRVCFSFGWFALHHSQFTSNQKFWGMLKKVMITSVLLLEMQSIQHLLSSLRIPFLSYICDFIWYFIHWHVFEKTRKILLMLMVIVPVQIYMKMLIVIPLIFLFWGGFIQEYNIDNWPVNKNNQPFLDAIKSSHAIWQLSAYDIEGNLINPLDYEEKLGGAICHVCFLIFHSLVKQKHIFNAIIRDITILHPPTTIASSTSSFKTYSPSPLQKKQKITGSFFFLVVLFWYNVFGFLPKWFWFYWM